jgi:branched-chain amino acid transport system permease protein
MTPLLQALFAGLVFGSAYALIAVGYTVVFKATRIFNLAQGDLMMVGVMSSFVAIDVFHLPQALAIPSVVAFVVLLSVVEERLVVRPFLGRSGQGALGWFIATLGFSFVIEMVVNLLYGNHQLTSVPSPLPSSAIHVGHVYIGYQQLLVIVTLVVVGVALELFYQRTWTGKAMRATAEDRGAAGLRGISSVRMSVIAFGLAGGVAGLTGVVMAPLTLSDPSVGLTYTLTGFLALAIGGFGSFKGAVCGAAVIGVAEQVWNLYMGATFVPVVGVLIVLIVLVMRPEGLFRTTVSRQV